MIVAGELDTRSVDPRGDHVIRVGIRPRLAHILSSSRNDMEKASLTVDDGAVKMNEEMVDSCHGSMMMVDDPQRRKTEPAPLYR